MRNDNLGRDDDDILRVSNGLVERDAKKRLWQMKGDDFWNNTRLPRLGFICGFV